MKPQNSHPHAAERKPAKRSGGFRKRTITPLEFVGAVASIATEASTLQEIWVKRELDPGFREKLMLAVARCNDAKYCSWAHHEWAVIEGASEEELAHIEKLDRSKIDGKTWLAISFVRELVAANFGAVPKELMRQMRARYTAEEIEQIALVAKVMDAMNLSSNTFDAFLSRLSGKPSPNGRIVGEAIMSAAVCCAFPPLLAFFSRSSNRSIDAVVRRMIGYIRTMDAEPALAEQGRRRPAPPRKKPAQVRKQGAPARRGQGPRLAV